MEYQCGRCLDRFPEDQLVPWIDEWICRRCDQKRVEERTRAREEERRRRMMWRVFWRLVGIGLAVWILIVGITGDDSRDYYPPNCIHTGPGGLDC